METNQRKDSNAISDVVETTLEVAGNIIEVAGEAIGGAVGCALEVTGEVLSSIG